MSKNFLTPKPYTNPRRPALKWRISYTTGGKRRREFFKNREEAEIRCRKLRSEQTELGKMAFTLTHQQRLDADRAIALLKGCPELEGRTLTSIVEELVARTRAVADSSHIEPAYERFLHFKQGQHLSEEYMNDLENRLAHFIRAFPGRKLGDIRPEEIRSWLESRGVCATTRNNLIRMIRVFFNFSIKQGYLDRSPMDKVDKYKVETKPVEILCPETMSRLMELARQTTPNLIPALVIQGFAGVRSQELRRLDWEDIHLDAAPRIVVETHKSKTARAREINIRENLLSWLTPYAGSSGKIVNSTYPHRLMKLRKKLAAEGLSFPRNGLRHSFGSYTYAETRNAAATAADLGHANTAMLFKHYRLKVTTDEAKRWWSITPPTAPTPTNAAVDLNRSADSETGWKTATPQVTRHIPSMEQEPPAKSLIAAQGYALRETGHATTASA